MSLKDNLHIIIIIVVFICANILFLNFYFDVWWDSSVYIGMGKYIFSLGQLGLWEESRPLILPLMLGIGQILNFDLIYFGRIISITFAILAIIAVYKIGVELFSKKVGVLAAFFTSFSYTFLFFSPNMLTEIPSTSFVLLAFYFFVKNRFFLMGVFSGLAIVTRLFQVFTLIGLALVFLVFLLRKPSFHKKFMYVILGAAVFVLPYVLLNYYLYNDILLPFKVQGHLTKTTGWMLYKEHGFYFTGLLKENFFIIFLLALPVFFKRNYKFYALLSIPLIYILIFTFVKHKEMRFMIAILPFLYLLVAYCLEQIYNRLKNKTIAIEFLSVMIVVWLLITFSNFTDVISYKHQRDDEGFLYFQDYLKNKEGVIWITNPLYALYSNSKIDGLLYFYSSKNLISFIDRNKHNVDIVLFNDCDVPCSPNDPSCFESKKILIDALVKFEKIYEKKVDSCIYRIFSRAIS